MVVFNNDISKMNILIVFNISFCNFLLRNEELDYSGACKPGRADTYHHGEC